MMKWPRLEGAPVDLGRAGSTYLKADLSSHTSRRMPYFNGSSKAADKRAFALRRRLHILFRGDPDRGADDSPGSRCSSVAYLVLQSWRIVLAHHRRKRRDF